MANEISAGINFQFSKNGVILAVNSGGFSVSVAGSKSIRNTVSVGIVDELLDLGDIATIGFVILHNLDVTNSVTVGSDGLVYPVKLKPGEWQLVRWNGAAVHAKADTGAILLDYTLVED